MKLDTFVIAFLMETFIEFDSIVGDSEDRCDKKERGRGRRCMRTNKHKNKCKFTPKGSISYNTVKALVSTLTGDEIKKVSWVG